MFASTAKILGADLMIIIGDYHQASWVVVHHRTHVRF